MTQPLLALPDSDIAPVTEDAVGCEDAQARCERDAAKKKRSRVAEVLFLKKAIELGYEVKWMQGNCKNYDVILERNGIRPMFVQVKSALLRTGNRYVFYNATNQRDKVYSSTAYDVLALYLWDRKEWVLYTRAELGDRQGTSYTPPDMRRRPVVSSAPDARDPNNWHLLDEVAAQLSQ